MLKNVLIFIGGVITGVILTFAIAFAFGKSHNSAMLSGKTYFETPGNIIDVKTLTVFQVLPSGDALAEGNGRSGLTVMLENNNNSYYDDQEIKVPEGKKVVQIGVYKYTTRADIKKTVPIVEIE